MLFCVWRYSHLGSHFIHHLRCHFSAVPGALIKSSSNQLWLIPELLRLLLDGLKVGHHVVEQDFFALNTAYFSSAALPIDACNIFRA